jgi:hypothetical protein
MQSLIRLTLFGVTILLAVACAPSVPTALDSRAKGDFTLYRLDGDRYPGEAVPEGGKLLHGWLILEACPIEDTATRNRIFRAFDDGMASPPRIQVDCFNPRHAISVVQADGVQMDWLICFQCRNWYSYENETMVDGGGTSRAPADVFNDILSACTGKTKTDDK